MPTSLNPLGAAIPLGLATQITTHRPRGRPCFKRSAEASNQGSPDLGERLKKRQHVDTPSTLQDEQDGYALRLPSTVNRQRVRGCSLLHQSRPSSKTTVLPPLQPPRVTLFHSWSGSTLLATGHGQFPTHLISVKIHSSRPTYHRFHKRRLGSLEPNSISANPALTPQSRANTNRQ